MKHGYLKESNGTQSATRLIFVAFSLYAIAASAFLFYKNNDYVAGISVFASISAIAVGLKLGQKPMEGKQITNENKEI